MNLQRLTFISGSKPNTCIAFLHISFLPGGGEREREIENRSEIDRSPILKLLHCWWYFSLVVLVKYLMES